MIRKHRQRLFSASSHLRRARRLYIFLCRRAVLASSDNTVIDWMNRRMVASGMYARVKPWYGERRWPGPHDAKAIAHRDERYRIARWLFNIERGSCGQAKLGVWSFWCRYNGFDSDFNKVRAAGNAEERRVG